MKGNKCILAEAFFHLRDIKLTNGKNICKKFYNAKIGFREFINN